MIKFLIEAGLLYELPQLNTGKKREYIRFIPHLIFLLQRKAFSNSKGFNPSEILSYLNRKNSKHPLRKDNIFSMLENQVLENLTLDLPPCSKCGTHRISENQNFVIIVDLN